MKPLEALMIEEELLLKQGAKPENHPLKLAYEIFPYLHIPFIHYIRAEATLLGFESDIETVSDEEYKKYKDYLDGLKKPRDKYTKEVNERLKKIEEKYNVKISNDIFNEYLIGLCERALNFVEKKLPGFLIETTAIEDIFSEKFKGERLLEDESVIKEATKIYFTTNQFLKYTIQKIADFYDLKKN